MSVPQMPRVLNTPLKRLRSFLYHKSSFIPHINSIIPEFRGRGKGPGLTMERNVRRYRNVSSCIRCLQKKAKREVG